VTEGRRLLLAVLRRTTVEYVARRCRVTPDAVYRWTSGLNNPGPRARRSLHDNYQIPLESWNLHKI
jgi:transcriptional regulator with XRE-family HTH domain